MATESTARRARALFVALGWTSVLSLAAGRAAAAQQSTSPTASDTLDTLDTMRNLPSVLSLTVRPRTMATGTQNPAAGEYALRSVVRHTHRADSTVNWKYPYPWPTPAQIRDAWTLAPRDTSYDPTAIVSVPPQCVGARRCPLLLALPGGGLTAAVTTDWLRPMADEHGLILLALTENHYSLAETDAALKETLQRFAIIPDRIAILGRCASGVWGARYGIDNPEVFSRIAVISGGMNLARVEQLNRKVEFLVDEAFSRVSEEVDKLRQAGFTVRQTMTIRTHGNQAEDYDLLGRWLQESWTMAPAARPRPAVFEPVLLTPDAVARLTTFWTRFFQEPDSIRTAGRRASIRDVLVVLPRSPVAVPGMPIAEREQRVIVPMSDMAALAAKYPSVAADLKKAGLTGRQHDAYRIALISATIAQDSRWPFDSTSVQAKNVAFLDQHADELQQLADAGIVNRDKVKESEFMGIFPPSDIERVGPLGIWRTP